MVEIVPSLYKKTYSICKVLPIDIVKNMFKQLDETKKDGRERGFNICTNARIIENINEKNTVIGEECVGTECYVDIKKRECPRDKPNKGIFHTHPAGPSFPSRSDMLFAKVRKYKYLCIGAKEPIEIRCMPSGISLKYVPRSVVPTFRKDLEEFEKTKKFWDKHITDCIISK